VIYCGIAIQSCQNITQVLEIITKNVVFGSEMNTHVHQFYYNPLQNNHVTVYQTHQTSICTYSLIKGHGVNYSLG